MKVIFVCWGNICRSPMAERVAAAWAEREGLEVTCTSAGVSDEERGHPIDHRARRVLTAAGYQAEGHRAHQITAAEIKAADLIIGLEELHLQKMRRLVPEATNLRLLTDFDPTATEPDIPDPWYGDEAGFHDTLAAIESAMPGILAEIRERAAS